MTDYRGEQEGELETLRCIYTDEELTVISDSPPTYQIRTTSEHEDIKLWVQVQFTYPDTYPDVPPDMEVVDSGPLSQEHVEAIERLLREEASESVGMVMVFTLVSAMQEKLGEMVDEVLREREKEKELLAEEQRRKEEAKFHGTPVTPESFLEWKSKFDEEKKVIGGRITDTSQGQRLTGRKMFERDASLALSDARFLTEDAESAKEETVEVDESLFQDLQDLEVDESIRS